MNPMVSDWESLIRYLSPQVERYVRSFESDPVEIAELVQETWCLAWDRHSTTDIAEIDWPKIRQCCRAVSSTRQIARRRDARVARSHAVDAQGRPGSFVLHEAIGAVDRATEAFEARTELAWDFVVLLAPRQREVLIWRVLFNKSEKETAELVGAAVGTVKAHYYRALKQLRRLAEGSSGESYEVL